ncbi:MAG: TlpA family protein disulfide reductase [Bacteroidales bacterium]|nr:MAG: TlpA family protein disulfide reductase [Bacteroidales bacterium]
MIIGRNIIFIIIIIGCFVSCNPDSRYQKIPITDFNGIANWFNKQNDSIYVINFWATWCSPCVKEFPYFERFANENRNRKIKVLMVNLDFPDQYNKRLIPFLKARKSKLDVIMLDDPAQNTWISRVDSSWSGSLPATLIYGKGERTFLEKELTYDDLEIELKKQLTNTNN